MNWDITKIYASREDFNHAKQQLLSDLEEIAKYEGQTCISSDNLFNCYVLLEKILEVYEKIYAYGMLTYHLDMSNQEGIKLFKEVETIGATLSTVTSFLNSEITYAKEEEVRTFIEEERFIPYKRDISDTLEKRKHILSKESERLLANYAEVFGAAENTFDILTNAEFKFGTFTDENGEEQELTDSNYSIYLKSASEAVRKQVFSLMYEKYSSFINTITELYLANLKKDAVTSKIRNYKSGIEKAVMHDDATIEVYNALIEAVNEGISANHKFVALKKKLLNKEDFHMYDLYVNPFQEEKDKIEYEDAKEEVLKALSVLGDEYIGLLNTAFTNQWIDVDAKENKRGGAYSMGVYGVHPYVLLNFVKSKRDVSTIAHELGHAIHSYYANENQNILNSNYTIMVAEVASTVNEILLSHYQLEHETNKQKKAEILYELLDMIRATFYRQSMFAEFEKIVHEKVEQEVSLSAEDFNQIYYDLNKKYFGDNMIVDKEIQFEWARIPHFYSNFYVYKYATGISAAITIATNILAQGKPYIDKYIEMLKQGCAKKSVDLLKMVDVDLESKDTYFNTIRFYEEKVKELETLL